MTPSTSEPVVFDSPTTGRRRAVSSRRPPDPTGAPPMPVAIGGQDLDLRYTWLVTPGEAVDLGNVVGRTDAEVFGARDAEGLTALKREVMDTGERRSAVEWLDTVRDRRLFTVTIEALRDAAGQMIGITVVMDEIAPAVVAVAHADT